MFEALFEAITGRSYWTGRSAVAEFGATPATEFADDLRGLSDLELLAFGDHIVAEARARRASVGAVR